ncbi:hypothetical protein [Nonomuraea soli]|uniref:DUF4386 family protein n=1 Tax=Nonomuraea soli TaxID=1032476 RepID=A0A7W0CKJ9_9ACTN|nr:hypothetical protein [Nonomuraea soli]MBA2892655.1 hypothetical protein [Nonomuraea soli]
MSDPHRLRRLAAGSSLLVTPVLYIAGVVIDPALRQGGGDTTGVYGRFPEQVSVSATLLHWSWVLLVPGIIGMIHLVRRRHVLLGHIVGAVALLGVVNFSALMLSDFVYSTLERAMPPAVGAKLADEALADPGATFGFQIPGFAGLVALLLLGLVLAADRQVPWWAPVAMLAGVFTAPIFPIGTVVGGVLFLAGSGAMGLRMLRMSQQEWNGVSAQPAAVADGKHASTR